MVIEGDRTELDQALENERLTVLLLSGATGSKAGEVHDFVADEDLEPWQRFFLITDLGVLTDDEKADWFDGDKIDCYAVLGGKELPKQVAQKGPVKDLLRADELPDIIEIESAFASGDEL